MILWTKIGADVEMVTSRQGEEKAIQTNTIHENRSRIKHKYKVGDWVLILAGGFDPKLELHKGPCSLCVAHFYPKCEPLS